MGELTTYSGRDTFWHTFHHLTHNNMTHWCLLQSVEVWGQLWQATLFQLASCFEGELTVIIKRTVDSGSSCVLLQLKSAQALTYVLTVGYFN
ncbi:hypothetical protein DPMN_122146 [Dreissena polymorpha]|uniref:Uncharacterized protein n=1 Tax=Dreissena polymorpha TaxID=45954 RepID=A0A9D4JQ47_DREPO|nr:hypothetical protein DPMN_122146 [Dreissena polymorpha]